ncbi:MAG TPA: (d)CMP kinase [Anaerolineaceae bacterium]|nr:(d)CMP kinase [Anaerolineaceae bacterium]
MPIPNIIAIDGPAASGKSTLGSRIAETLGYLYFDTGVMYRAVTWAAIERQVDRGSEDDIVQLAEGLDIDVMPPSVKDGRDYDVLVGGKDITWEIRRHDVEKDVSQVSAYPGVRAAMTRQQRRIGQRGKVVMVGRDIGTVVFPEAELKIYLDASVEERARRRYEELLQRGEPADYKNILDGLRRRDKIDSTRRVAPLRVADDAKVLCSDGLGIDAVYEQVRQWIDP